MEEFNRSRSRVQIAERRIDLLQDLQLKSTLVEEVEACSAVGPGKAGMLLRKDRGSCKV